MHTSNHRLNYGKDTCSWVSCYITCSCQSILAINDILDYAINLVLKTLHPSPWGLLPLLASLLRSSLCFLFPYLELSLVKWVRPQILLCALTTNQGPWKQISPDSSPLTEVRIMISNRNRSFSKTPIYFSRTDFTFNWWVNIWPMSGQPDMSPYPQISVRCSQSSVRFWLEAVQKWNSCFLFNLSMERDICRPARRFKVRHILK